MDEVYKDAYIDGFKDALFFTGRFFYNNYKTITKKSYPSLPEREIFPVFLYQKGGKNGRDYNQKLRRN